MPRIAGVDIPNDKQMWIALTYIHGVGRYTAEQILKQCNIERDLKAGKLSEDEVSRISQLIVRDLTVEGQLRRRVSQNISRLKDVIHIGFRWINKHKLLKLWQDFTRVFFTHLKDVGELDEFYFLSLENASDKWDKQNPKRVAIESYVKLLEHEGRLHTEMFCFLCTNEIKDKKISLIRAYLPTHKRCSHTLDIDKKALDELYTNKSSIFLNDTEVDRLWYILLEGL